MRTIGLMLLLAVAGTVMASGDALAAEGSQQPQKHVVTSGESLSSIATDFQLDSWRTVWNANPQLSNPDIISPGEELIVKNDSAERPLPPGYGAAVATQPVSVPTRSYGKPVVKRSAVPSGDLFARIRARESGGNYATNTGNGYYGAYQFSPGTWRSVGGQGLPSQASPAEQDARAALLYQRRGCSPWPNTCH